MLSEKTTIIILNWNRAADTIACVRSVLALRGGAFDILLIDNGSTDQSAERLRAMFPEIPLIVNAHNLGFAEGNNVGIRRALEGGATQVLLLNNDTVVDPGMLEALRDAARANPEAGFLGAKISYHDDPTRLWMGKPVWDARACQFSYLGANLPDAEAGLEAVSESAYACGCALMVTRAAIEQVGLMDPRFFCYFEEVDWCFRGAAAGFKSIYVPAARLWHKVSASSAGGRESPVVCYYRTRNRLLWAQRHLSRQQRLRLFLQDARVAHARFGWREQGLMNRVRRAYWNLLTWHRDPLLRAWRCGVWDYVRRRFGPAPADMGGATSNIQQGMVNVHRMM